MSVSGKLLFLTIVYWIPILLLFYLPNTLWGIGIETFAQFRDLCTIQSSVKPDRELISSGHLH